MRDRHHGHHEPRAAEPARRCREPLEELSTLDHAGEVFDCAHGLSVPRLVGWTLRSIFRR